MSIIEKPYQYTASTLKLETSQSSISLAILIIHFSALFRRRQLCDAPL
jgi:hypothetical protein